MLSIGFSNPWGFPIDALWTVGAELNGTNYGLGGFLSTTIPSGNSIQKMSFYVPQLSGNYTLNRAYDHESFQIFGNWFSEPRIFAKEFDETLQVHGSRLVNETAIQMPTIVRYLFSSHSNLSNTSGESCSWFQV